MKSLIYAVVLFAYLISVPAKGLKILGGFTEVHNQPSTRLYGTLYEWGTYQTGLEGTNVLIVGHSYCWNSFANSGGYCYWKLVVSTNNDTNEEHYEILGSKLAVLDSNRQHVVTTHYYYGRRLANATDSQSQYLVYSGSAQIPGENRRSYANLHLIVKKSTRNSVIDELSWQAHNTDNERHSDDERFSGKTASSSTRVTIGEFNCWASYGARSICYIYIWKAHTKLISHSLRYADKDILEVTEVPKSRPLILENHGSGLSTIDFPRIKVSEQVTTTSTARFISTFDFAIDDSAEIGFDAFGANVSVGFNCHFEFSSISEMSNVVKESTYMTITWPHTCDAGFRVTYRVVENSETQRIPVDFVFDRAGSRWTESKDVEVTLTGLTINADDCCINASASTICSTEQLPMC